MKYTIRFHYQADQGGPPKPGTPPEFIVEGDGSFAVPFAGEGVAYSAGGADVERKVVSRQFRYTADDGCEVTVVVTDLHSAPTGMLNLQF